MTEISKEHIITVAMDLEHRSGVLSNVLAVIASNEGNVLTMNQSIPLQGYANVVLSVDVSMLNTEIDPFMELLKTQSGVRHAAVIGQG